MQTLPADITLIPQFETGVVTNGDLRYNIQMARDAAGCWHQRHIWFRDHIVGERNPPKADPWIVSGMGRREPEPHFRPGSTISEGACATCHQNSCDCSAEAWLGAAA